MSKSECGRLSKALDKSMEVVATSLLLSRLSFQSSIILNSAVWQLFGNFHVKPIGNKRVFPRNELAAERQLL